MSGAIRVKVSANWERWERGFGTVGRDMGDRGRVIWSQVTDVMFDRSQTYAHVVSGDMKRSGSAETGVEGTELIGRITYDEDYSIFEERRGGEHAYIGRAYEATERTFRRALPKAWEEIVESWR